MCKCVWTKQEDAVDLCSCEKSKYLEVRSFLNYLHVINQWIKFCELKRQNIWTEMSTRKRNRFKSKWIFPKTEPIFKPPHDKTNKMACAPSEDSDQLGHPPSLIRVFAVHMKKAWVLSYPLSAQQWLWSDWADAQADLSIRWAHMPFCWFCREVAHFIFHQSQNLKNKILKLIFIITKCPNICDIRMCFTISINIHIHDWT